MLKYTVDVTPNAAKTEVLKHNDVLLRVKDKDYLRVL